MVDYFFVLGRNPELSRAEVFLYLKARNIRFSEIIYEENFLILEIEETFEININELGGTIKLGKLKKFTNKKEFFNFLEKEEFVPADKFSYSVLGNIEEDVFIEKFKKERKKAMIRRKGKRLVFQNEEISFLSNSDFEIFAFQKKDIFLGLVEQKYDSKIDEFIDIKKPFRRESLAISPRLSKILINLAGLKKGELMLDPFCGIGVILQQALLKGINCIGVDKDKNAIEQAKQNIDWLKNSFKIEANCSLINKNSLNLEKNNYDGIVGETPLGELLRRKSSKEEAKKFLFNFEKRIFPFLIHFKKIKKENAKIVLTFPCFNEIQIGENFIKKSSLKVYSDEKINFPIIEKRKEQFVNRQIWVLY